MGYEVGKTKIVKHCYDVFLRSHNYAATASWASSLASIAAADLNMNITGDFADWSTNAGSLTTSLITEWGKIGQLEEKPSLKSSEGEEINLASCDPHTISENLEALLNDVEVSSANYENLRELFALDNVDILFYDSNYATETAGMANINLKAFLEIVGNDLNKVNITGKKEVGNADSYFGFVTIT